MLGLKAEKDGGSARGLERTYCERYEGSSGEAYITVGKAV